MMVLDHVGDEEAMVSAQLGQQPLARTTETSPEPRRGTLSCLSARPPDLDFWTGTRPRVVGVSPSIVPFLYFKRTAAARSLVSRYGRSIVLSPLRAHYSRGTTQETDCTRDSESQSVELERQLCSSLYGDYGTRNDFAN
jgi:hypothetical protein